jgi:hypothetical protein
MCNYKKYVTNVEVDIDESINSRYLLVAEFDNDNIEAVAIIMKNPSKANKEKSDKTVNNVLEVAYREGFGKVYILNLYSYYSQDVKDIKELINANDEEDFNKNDECIQDVIKQVDKVIVGWGTIQGSRSFLQKYNNRVKRVYELIQHKELKVIDEDFTNSNYPKHPQTLALNSSKVTLKAWKPTKM